MVVLISVFFVFVWAALSYKYARVLCILLALDRTARFPLVGGKIRMFPCMARGSMQWQALVQWSRVLLLYVAPWVVSCQPTMR